MGETKNKVKALDTENLEIRAYQTHIAAKCVHNNSLVVLPTGLGKTIIAVLVAHDTLETSPPESKVIVLAPTRPLINQHYDTFLKFLKFPEDKFMVLTGKTPPEKRKDFFKNTQILFYTPQTLRNDLVNKKYTLKNTALIVFDEAHHASGDYPYTMIAEKFMEENPDGTILGLTASPGASKKKINDLCNTLFIPVENIHIRTRQDSDVKTYLKPMDVYKIGVDLTPLMDKIYHAINTILEERLQYLSQLSFIEAKGENLFQSIIRKDLLKLNNSLASIINSDQDKTGVYSALSINAQALILFHMIELVEQQGLDILLDYLKKLYKDALKRVSSKAVKMLAADHRIHFIHQELQKTKELFPDQLIHPKYFVLVRILVDQLDKNPSSRILIFIKLRDSVKNTVKKLKTINGIKPVRFVGQATKSKEDKGLSQKEQLEILDKFKQGVYNVLISTNVGEEGLDIAECDLVIFYDVVASEIRLIQRKGRTARHRAGKVLILYCKGTHDEVYLKIALSKIKRMNSSLRNPSHSLDTYLSHSNSKTINQIPEENHLSHPVGIHNKRHQSSLGAFFTMDEHNAKRKEPVVKISKLLPMKFGLRTHLKHDGIFFEVADSDLHIVIFNKVLLQIYNPMNISLDTLKTHIEDFTQICELLILIFDFIEFKEKIEGEKRIRKQNLLKFGKMHNIQIINIDNEEELYFIIKSIIENTKEKEC